MNEKNFVTPNEAFPVAYGLKAADAGKGLCYADRIADAIKEVVKTLPVENGKIVFGWPVIVAVINLLWSQFKKAAKDCDGVEIVLKRPTGFLGVLSFVASSLGLRIWD
jgi:hypothetical protein